MRTYHGICPAIQPPTILYKSINLYLFTFSLVYLSSALPFTVRISFTLLNEKTTTCYCLCTGWLLNKLGIKKIRGFLCGPLYSFCLCSTFSCVAAVRWWFFVGVLMLFTTFNIHQKPSPPYFAIECQSVKHITSNKYTGV